MLSKDNMFNFLRDKNPDIVLLQETHSNKKIQRIWRNEWGGKIIFDHGESNARGVCDTFLNPERNLKFVKLYAVKQDVFYWSS